MPPTIRVDDQVYKWLQSQAIPFEDNPNSVLRRLAGLDMAAFRERSGTAQTGGIGSRARADGPMVDAPSTSSSPGLSRGSTWMAGSSPAMKTIKPTVTDYFSAVAKLASLKSPQPDSALQERSCRKHTPSSAMTDAQAELMTLRP